jgi:hypothetical protein
MTRGHRSLLRLRCRAFSSPSPCRFIPALSQIRKITKTRGQFPTEDAARKLIYLAIDRAERKWRRAYDWNAAMAAFKIHFGDRIPNNAI